MDGTVLLLDSTNTLLQCDEDEILRRASRIFRNADQVLIAGEYLVWPRFLTWHGRSIEAPYASPFPRSAFPGEKAPLRYPNTGALLGAPAAIAG
eukprot:4753202-Prymnesium_polylepis.1